MRIVDLIQKTQAWLDWRAEGIGGSDVASVLNMSPFCSRDQLLRERLGLAVRQENWAMKKGASSEDGVLQRVEEKLKIVLSPMCIEHDHVPWARVSLDGGNVTKRTLAEIKVPNANVHQAALEGLVPDYYMVQVQYQLWVADFDLGYFCTSSENRHFADRAPTTVPISPDPEMLAWIVDECEKFWDELQIAKAHLRIDDAGRPYFDSTLPSLNHHLLV